jgi:aldehyde dehydrogenase family protein
VTSSDLPHIPILRFGQEYTSLELTELRSPRTGKVLARVSQANPGLVRRDLLTRQRAGAAALRAIPFAELLARIEQAGHYFSEGDLPISSEGPRCSAQDYLEALSETSGLPHALCRRNMDKVRSVLDLMPRILDGLTRGMDLGVLERGLGEQAGVPVSYGPTTDSLGVVLPSNSPGVNSIWMPAIALRTAVALKPGREEPWTPLRIVRAFEAAGIPSEAFGFYPTSHEGARQILDLCGRSQLFGDAKTTAPWAADARVEVHGPGYSKVVLGEDVVDDWRAHLDVLVASVADNGGRSCINCSTILVPRHADEIAEALAARLAELEPRPADDPEARLAAFANPKVAEWIDGSIEAGLGEGTVDVSAGHRTGPRLVELEGATYLRPTLVRAERGQTLAGTEFLFPFSAVVEVPQAEMIEALGKSLVVTALTRDPAFQGELLASAHIERLNLGPVPTSHVDWDQPHEGNLFEFLYARRAIRTVEAW